MARSVRVLHVGSELEFVCLAVGRDVGHGLGQSGHHLGAFLALGVLVGQQWGVDVPQHLPAFQRVGQLRVDVVGERRRRDGDVAAARATAATTAATLSSLAARGHAEGGQRHDTGDDDDPVQLDHLVPFWLTIRLIAVWLGATFPDS